MPALRLPLTLAATGAVLLALSACSGAEPSDPADGAVVLYSGRSENLVGPLVERFEEESGIDVEVRYDGTTALAALLLEEGDASPAQVFLSQDAGALGAVAGAGLLATLPDDVAGAALEGFTSTDGRWVGVTGRARVIAYDGDELTAEDLPDSVLGLTAPQWSGRVGIAPTNASFQSFVTALRVLEGEAAAQEWLEAMVANDVQLFESNGAILEAVNSGRLDVGLINHYYWFETAAELGQDAMRAQIAFLEPGDPGALVNVSGAGVLTGAADDPEAVALVTYLLSEDAQRYFAEETFEYPLAAGVPAPEGLPALEELRNPELDLADLDSLAETVELVAQAGLT